MTMPRASSPRSPGLRLASPVQAAGRVLFREPDDDDTSHVRTGEAHTIGAGPSSPGAKIAFCGIRDFRPEIVPPIQASASVPQFVASCYANSKQQISIPMVQDIIDGSQSISISIFYADGASPAFS